MSTPTLLQFTDQGIYCAAGDFFIDPWVPVQKAVVTHAHADHLRRGSAAYLFSAEGEQVFRARLWDDAVYQTAEYGETVNINGVQVSLHPAGHILGSAQVRVEYRGEVWVVSGDYKLEPDRTCTPFEPVKCHTFITEATFGLPIYHWSPQQTVFDQINAWWRANAEAGKSTLIYGYALGKAQRLLAGVDPTIGPIYTHGSVERLNHAYRESGIDLPETTYATSAKRSDYAGTLIIAPLSARGTSWVRRFGSHASGFASGWMRIRGARRRRAVDRGFVISDHVDWDSLMQAIKATGAERIWVTHGYVAVVARWLREQGYESQGFQTRYEGEREELEEATVSETELAGDNPDESEAAAPEPETSEEDHA
jgi:putative mRNA 3-end processing factor